MIDPAIVRLAQTVADLAAQIVQAEQVIDAQQARIAELEAPEPGPPLKSA